ncbi:MAG: hypothetical protein AMJ88_00360 [Anaerolineae bacterium SM23_ 63]|nr:MAG: hypothetical protein AMJ88_00360 [Anaerolineae bacterium SM23_ 63]HEY47243.1 BMP family ABC transporter substrate-binding protein [Anaerolineae bacterium]
MNLEHRSNLTVVAILALSGVLGLILGACGSPMVASEITPTDDERVTLTPEPTPTLSPTFTLSPPRVILLASEEIDPELFSSVEEVIRELANEGGYVVETRTSLSSEEIDASFQLVVGFPPDQDLEILAESMEAVQFLAVGISGLSTSDNLSVIGPMGFRPDQLGFIAGYISAVITQDWRVGVIGRSDTPTGQAGLNGFVNGARYFCGTCRPIFPPYVQYPIQVGLSEVEIQNAWQEAVDILIEAAVHTVYVSPEIEDPRLLSALVESGMILIGGHRPGDELLRNWVATLRVDPAEAVRDLWEDLLGGQGGASVPIPMIIQDANPDLISYGRQRLVETILQELLEGFIDTGVNPLTGQNQ